MKLTFYSFLLSFLFSCSNSDKKQVVSNDKDLVEKKATEIRKNYLKENDDSIFLNMINNEIVIKKEDKKYIADITNLDSIKLIKCDPMSIHYKDDLYGKKIELKLSLKIFNHKKHKIKYKSYIGEDKDCEKIDGKEPWGGYYGCPKTEVDKLEITINGKRIEMLNKLKDVYNLHMCDYYEKKYFNLMPLLKYDKKNDVFYLYVSGGNAAGTYFGKFIFNENKFINRYLLHYVQLSETALFRDDFKGF